MRFIDLFAGLGGFHRALANLGHECVFASEVDTELRRVYELNFPSTKIHGDIRAAKVLIPPHDILCAGFPCQPFSKSGMQNGRRDRTRGTLFHEIVDVIEAHHPPFVLLENVGNFERHNRGRTWKVVRETLQALGYHVRGTTHVTTGGHGLISPHHLGHPHTRERFFIVATKKPLAIDPFPPREKRTTTLTTIVQDASELSELDRTETRLTKQQVDCIDHWNKLLSAIPDDVPLPSFPIWGDEIRATYPFETKTPSQLLRRELLTHVRVDDETPKKSKEELLASLPSYARTPMFPDWKKAFIRQNRAWFERIRPYLLEAWVARLAQFPPSLRKLEWNCKGEQRDLWQHVLQFRPSGLRVKRFSSSPALVAMTTTQTPILGPKRRFLTRTEARRLQGLPDSHILPSSRASAFAALGNAVHVDVVRSIIQQVLTSTASISPRLRVAPHDRAVEFVVRLERHTH